MPEQPLVSIIVPIYNAQDHIARCVESIRRQTYKNIEILLLNDGSKDVSLQVCAMYARVDDRIVLIDKANSGVAATRNLGLRQARGKYLQFVDADDTIQPYATEMLVARAEERGADLVSAPYNRLTPPRPRSGLKWPACSPVGCGIHSPSPTLSTPTMTLFAPRTWTGPRICILT